ncbi:MAG: hypothetical protein HUU20_13405 [Pirellulales bacterium]|nr:hypothetical protein [Pirellulales bacterium]
MARTYAGILGPLAFLASLALGVVHAEETDAMLFRAWVWLLVFSGVGCVIGWIAGRTIEESVHASISAELQSEEAVEKPGAASTA